MAFYSHITTDTDSLIDALGMSIKETQAKNPFARVSVFTPNSNVEEWLKIELANRNGSAMNLDFSFIESGLWQILTQLDVDAVDDPKTSLDQGMFQLLIAGYLMSDELQGQKNEGPLGPFKNYLYDTIQSMPFAKDDFGRRVWQLSQRLAFYFREYEFSCPEILESWQQGKGSTPTTNSSVKNIEEAQTALYWAVFGPNGWCEQVNRTLKIRLLSLAQYAKILEGFTSCPVDALHVFNPAQLSDFHLIFLEQLSDYCDVHLYCREYPLDAQHNNLQKDLGSCGRLLNIKLKSKERSPATFGDSPLLLNHLQNLITADKQSSDHGADSSIEVLSCPGLYREVETVYYKILDELATDKTLKLKDIAIAVPDIGEYRAAVDSVFSRDADVYLPKNIADSSASNDSILGQGLMAFMKALDDNFTRKDFFSIVHNPCFMAAWNISAEDIEIWAEWTKKLNVYHSFDQEHKEEQGYAATPMFTWRQALQRLRLSKVMLVQEQDGVTSDWQGLIPYEDMHSQSGSFDRFLNLIEQLELLHKRSHKATEIRQWGDIVESMLTQFYAIPAEYKEEAFVKQCVLKSVQRWPALDPYEFNTQVSLALVTSMLEDALSAIPSCYGTFLSGISIASIRKIQSIPFRHIYILGMQEGQFPGRSKDSILDLRQALEDFQPIDEVSLNRYAFLECLLSAKEKLVVTYQGRDLHSGEEFFPNSVLSQLLRSIKDVTKGSFNIQDIPLRCDQPDYTLTEVYAKHDKLLSLYKATGNLDLQKECSPEYFFPQLPEDKVKNVKVGDLKNFLKDPHVAVASYQLGLYGADNADETLRSIEPLVVEFPFSVQLPKLAAKYLLDNPELNEAQFKEYFEQLYHNAQLKGNVPEDVFGEIDFEEQLQLFINGGQLPHWHESFHKEHPLESSCHLSLSSTMQPDEPYHFYLPPLKLNDEEVHLSGSLADCRDLPEALTCLVLTTSKGADFSHHMIKPMLFYICALCSDEGRLWLNGRPLRIYKLYKSDILDMAVFEFSVTQEQAEVYLQSLVEGFLGTKSFDLLPFRHFKKTKPYPFVEDNERVDDYPERIASKIAADQKFKLNELEQLLDPQIPEDAWDLVKKRFSLLCQQLTEVKL